MKRKGMKKKHESDNDKSLTATAVSRCINLLLVPRIQRVERRKKKKEKKTTTTVKLVLFRVRSKHMYLFASPLRQRIQ